MCFPNAALTHEGSSSKFWQRFGDTHWLCRTINIINTIDIIKFRSRDGRQTTESLSFGIVG
jgi:hypothetical protein